MLGVPTYKGEMDNPEPFDPNYGLSKLEFTGGTPEELAKYLFDLSSASYQGDDIMVCAIGGIRSDDNRAWELALINVHQT